MAPLPSSYVLAWLFVVGDFVCVFGVRSDMGSTSKALGGDGGGPVIGHKLDEAASLNVAQLVAQNFFCLRKSHGCNGLSGETVEGAVL